MKHKKYRGKPCPDWPGQLGFCTITKSIKNIEDIAIFHEQLSDATAQGYTILNCGINGATEGAIMAWAVLAANVIDDLVPKEE